MVKLTKDWAVAALTVTLLAGCATEVHDTVAITGRITDRLDTSGTMGSYGVYRPGMGGALGGAVAYLLASAKGTASSRVYELQLNDGTTQGVPSNEDHAIGECFDVLVPSSKVSLDSSLKPGDVTLRPSTGCKPKDESLKLAFTGRISERFEPAKDKDSTTNSVPTSLAYELQLNDGTTQAVPSKEEHVVGECLEVWVESSPLSLNHHLRPEDVTLRPSSACQPPADPKKGAAQGATAEQSAT